MFRLSIATFLALFLCVTTVAGVAPLPGSGSEDRFVPGEILVCIRVAVESSEIDGIRAQFGARYSRTLYRSSIEKWIVPVGSEEVLSGLLAKEESIIWAEPNYRVHALTTTPDDPGFGTQWGHAQIASTSAWGHTTGSAEIVIAVIDSGIDGGHPDLASKVVPGYDFVDDDADPTDLHGHGTNVAGIAAAVTNNTVGMAGTSWGAMVMPVRVLDEDGSGTAEGVVDGITWAATHGAHILNLSLGGSSYSQAQQDAVNAAHAAGHLVIAAMGNWRASGNPTFYPAACDNVMAVAATNSNNGYSWFSQFGPHCDISAPGGDMAYLHDPEGIYSTLPTYICTVTNEGYFLNYDRMQGTSQAAPFVAGLAALVMSVAPNLGPDQVQGLIENAADDLGPAGWDRDYGWGRINAEAAIEASEHIFSDGFELGDTTSWD